MSHARKTLPSTEMNRPTGDGPRVDVTIHPTAIVESSQIGSRTRIWAFAHVLPGATIGANCNIGDHAFVESGAVVGNNVTLKNHVCVWEGVVLEDDVFVGPGVLFTNDRHPRSPRMTEAHDRYSDKSRWLARTVVRRGGSIGAGATIVAGVTLGQYCLVAAGAVVTRDVEPHALVAGTPATQRGYVCRCGQPLDVSNGTWSCAACGSHFTIPSTIPNESKADYANTPT